MKGDRSMKGETVSDAGLLGAEGSGTLAVWEAGRASLPLQVPTLGG